METYVETLQFIWTGLKNDTALNVACFPSFFLMLKNATLQFGSWCKGEGKERAVGLLSETQVELLTAPFSPFFFQLPSVSRRAQLLQNNKGGNLSQQKLNPTYDSVFLFLLQLRSKKLLRNLKIIVLSQFCNKRALQCVCDGLNQKIIICLY